MNVFDVAWPPRTGCPHPVAHVAGPLLCTVFLPTL